MRHLFLAAYDVTDDTRLRNALKLTRGFAVGGQRSVHECLLSPGERDDLLTALDFSLSLDVDRFLLLHLDPRSQIFVLGRALRPPLPTTLYIR